MVNSLFYAAFKFESVTNATLKSTLKNSKDECEHDLMYRGMQIYVFGFEYDFMFTQ